jgi:hypothetical protein
VEQGKSSYLAASAREDLQRPDCAVIVLDPKGDAANGERRQAVGVIAENVQFLASRGGASSAGTEGAEAAEAELEEEPIPF